MLRPCAGLQIVATLAALAASTLAAPSAATPKTLGAPAVIPATFNLLGLADLITPMTFTMHIPSKDNAGLAAWLDNNAKTLDGVLTVDQLAQYIAPSDADLAAVQGFLKARAIPDSAISYNTFKNQITVHSTVGQAAKLFNAHFSKYKLANDTVSRTKQYTVPAEIANAVEFISPLASFVSYRTVAPVPQMLDDQDVLLERASTMTAANCSTSAVTPTCLRQYYGSYGYTPKAVSGVNDIFVAGFIGQNFAQSDLTTFLKKYRPEAASAKVQVINRAGATNVGISLFDGAEAMLDTETTVSATYPLKSVYFNYGTSTTQGDIFEQAMQDILANYDQYGKPGVYTISYGSDESDVTQAEANAMCNTAMQLSALGTTILIASGDDGVGGQQGDTCPPFVPTYPSGCPYLTSVGATQSFAPEVAVDESLAGFYSGSGFSGLFPRPSFQDSAVSAYKPPASAQGKYNTSGRAYPDVSAQGSKYAIQYMGIAATVGGTSASTPTFASIIALINDARRQVGKSNVGWINPALYANPSGVKDITSGNSFGCSGESTSGFSAAAGWDPASGLGTPLFDKLRTVLGA